MYWNLIDGMSNGGHTYTLATLGLKRNKEATFASRQAANEYMHKLCGKYGLTINEVYDDKHCKTYICGEVRIFINRN